MRKAIVAAMIGAKSRLFCGTTLILAATAMTPAKAQGESDISTLRQELQALRESQSRTAARIDAIEASLDQVEGKPVLAPNRAVSSAEASGRLIAGSTAGSTMPQAAEVADSRLDLSGDMRVRYEINRGDRDAATRNRWVARARVRASYAISDWLAAGGQVVTGDPDDPNTADTTLGNFDDDLTIALDQAYLRANFGNLQLQAGKYPQPLVRTDLVWDSDVSPQGASAAYKQPLGAGTSLKATGLYFIIDDSVVGKDSRMIGGQVALETAPTEKIKFELAAGYYDYRLSSLAGADSGDFRSNLMVGGRYQSDFNLLDVVGAVTWKGLGGPWPVRVVGDYVHNYGAATSEDTGYAIDLYIGRGNKRGDWRFNYGYAQTETDAVLAAFSHDNTGIATNYAQHTLALDYAVTDNLLLNATLYNYKPLRQVNARLNDPNDWLQRVRFNILANF